MMPMVLGGETILGETILLSQGRKGYFHLENVGFMCQAAVRSFICPHLNFEGPALFLNQCLTANMRNIIRL